MSIPVSKVKIKVFALFLAVVFLGVSVSAAAPAVPSAQLLAEEGYVVGGIDSTEYQHLKRAEALEFVTLDIYVTDDYDYANSLLQSGIATYVEPNIRAAMLEDPSVSEPVSGPNWVNRDLNTSYASSLGLTGKGVRIALIDSGIDRNNINLTHAVIEEGRNYYTIGKPVLDLVGHGSYVAQMIAGDGFDGAVRGIAPEATLVPLQAFDKVNGYAYSVTVAELAKCIVDAVQEFHCDVINMSWGLSPYYQHSAVEDAIQAAYAAGSILVSASGNTSAFPQYSLVYPAAYPEVISVGSYGEGRVLASTSIQNSEVTLAAPGHLISAFKANHGSEETTYSKQTITGTSFSSPAIAAICALVRQACPDANQSDMLRLIQENADDLGPHGWDMKYGYGALPTDMIFSGTWYEQMAVSLSPAFGGTLEMQEQVHGFAACYKPNGQMVRAGVFETIDNVLTMPHLGVLEQANDNFQFLLYDAEENFMQESMLRKAS